MTRRASVDGVGKISLDLSSLRSSVSEGMQTGSLTSPMVMHQGYVMSPGYDTLSPSSENQQPEWHSPETPSHVQQAPCPQQQHIIQDALQMPTHFPCRQFQDRFASAPEISPHDLPANSLSMMLPTPAAASPPAQQQPQHSPCALRTRTVDGDAAFTITCLPGPLPHNATHTRRVPIHHQYATVAQFDQPEAGSGRPARYGGLGQRRRGDALLA